MAKKRTPPLISSEDTNEIFNSVSHSLGAVLSLVGMAALLILSASKGKWLHFVTFLVYGLFLFLSMLFSSLLHSFLAFKRYLKAFGILDHTAIYALIAGTYTPLCLVVVGGALGWTVFGVVWGLAILSIVFRSIFFERMGKWMTIASYLFLGWLAVLMIEPVYSKLGFWAVSPIALGGALYTLGAIIFVTGKPNPFPPHFGNHEIWHTLVFLANLAMYLAMLLFVLPYGK
jgi:hemolysin III